MKGFLDKVVEFFGLYRQRPLTMTAYGLAAFFVGAVLF